jgi:lipopolysaccharide heptosyltransferase II
VSDHFQWLPERPQVSAWVREKWRTEGAPWIVLLPGARWETKRWPVEHFAALVNRLAAARPDVKFAILGSAADTALARPITDALPERVLDLTGQTSLPEMVEWVRLSRLVITNDTGPMHVAAAVGRPVVALFGPTDPASTGPYRQREYVIQNTALPCVPCFKGRCSFAKPLECLRSITPEMACAAALKRLAQATG